MSTVSTIAVIGAGQMGRGIAQVAAQAGCTVLLLDAVSGAAAKGRATPGAGLDKLVAKGELEASAKAAVLERIRAVAAVRDCAGAQCAIEAIVEDEAQKRRLFGELDGVLPKGAILASNTSSISITRLA